MHLTESRGLLDGADSPSHQRAPRSRRDRSQNRVPYQQPGHFDAEHPNSIPVSTAESERGRFWDGVQRTMGLTIRNCRAGPQGTRLKNAEAASPREFVVLRGPPPSRRVRTSAPSASRIRCVPGGVCNGATGTCGTVDTGGDCCQTPLLPNGAFCYEGFALGVVDCANLGGTLHPGQSCTAQGCQ